MPPADAPAPPSPLTGLAAGTLTSVLTKSLTHPLDTLKAQLQVAAGTPAAPPSTAAAARAIWATQGPAGFWRGLTATLVGAAPGSAAYFGGVEAGRAGAGALGLPPGPITDASVGVVAQLVGGLAFTPADVIRERVQAGPALAAAGGGGGGGGGAAAAAATATPRAALAAALAAGGVGGLLKGYWATNAVWLPWGALFFVGYGRLTALAVDRRRGKYEVASPPSPSTPPPSALLPAHTLAACAAVAAGGAAALTHPLDVVKTRLQVLSGPGGGGGSGGGGGGSGGGAAPNLNARAVAADLWRTAGPRAFTAGGSARVAQLSLATALQWVTYEKAKAWVEGRRGD